MRVLRDGLVYSNDLNENDNRFHYWRDKNKTIVGVCKRLFWGNEEIFSASLPFRLPGQSQALARMV